jgi:hypothetical protein
VKVVDVTVGVVSFEVTKQRSTKRIRARRIRINPLAVYVLFILPG